jgi:ATPase family associated with various cellular activities (AAA)
VPLRTRPPVPVSSPEYVRLLDGTLSDLDAWIPHAGQSLLTFWDSSHSQFIRETFRRDPGEAPVGKTSTNRSLSSLIDLLRYLAEERRTDQIALERRAESTVAAVYGNYLSKLLVNLDLIRPSDVNGKNMFTDAHLVLAASAASAWADRTEQSWDHHATPLPSFEERHQIRAAIREIVDENVGVLVTQLGGRVHRLDVPHDFITLHAVRAVDTYRATSEGHAGSWPDALTQRVERDVLAQIGFYSAGIWSQFDPGELAFSAVLLDRLAGARSEPLTRRATEIVGAVQTADGSWPTSRVISYGGRRLLHVASSEVALALVMMLLNQQSRGTSSAAELIFPILARSFGLVQATFVTVDSVRGWANDRTRWADLAESWATAIVLAFLVRYRDAVIACRQDAVLTRYDVAFPARAPALAGWADLDPLIATPETVTSSGLRLSDPTDDGNLAQMLIDAFIAPVTTSPGTRPSRSSLVVPGPPGTRKTTMVWGIAEGLNWPIVTLSPPDFLADGLDGFEKHAAAIFKDLMRLRRVVILFDEMEDFFKKRDENDSGSSAGSRTLGAFITAGMLPRLQALRRQNWALFVLCTNADLSQLDPAALREGRFDYQIRLNNPTLKAQQRYIRSLPTLGSPALEALDEALTVYAGTREAADHQVTWAVLDDIAKKALAESQDGPSLLSDLAKRIQQVGPPPLPGTG